MLAGSRSTSDPGVHGDETPPPWGVGLVVRGLCNDLDRRGVLYCALRGLDQLHVESDAYEVDLLVASRDLIRFCAVAQSFGFQRIHSWGCAPHTFFVKRAAGLRAWIKLDVVTDLRYGHRREFRAGRPLEWLNRRRAAGGIYRLSPADEFTHLVLHGLLDKGALDPRHCDRLQVLRRSLLADPAALALVAAQFESLAPALTWHEVAFACDRLDWSWIVSRRRTLVWQLVRRQTLSAGVRLARAWTGRRLRFLEGLRLRRGAVIALLGPDGAGKTTVATALADSAPLPVRRVYMGYGQGDDERGSRAARVLRRLASAAPHAGSRARRLRLGLRWAARALLQISRSGVVRARRAAGQIVVLDRHVYDLWLQRDTRQYQSKARRALRWCLTGVSPKPDLVVVLDVPAAVLAQRKAEWPAEVLAEQRAAYLALAATLPHAVVLDAARDVDRVTADITDELWKSRTVHVQPAAAAVVVTPDVKPLKKDAGKDEARDQIRGSSLLLSGRFIAMGLALLAQVLLIRYLTPADFGRWMYALSIVVVLKSVAGLGIDRAVTRFVSVYYERGDRARLLGVIVLTIGAVLGAGALMIGALYALPDQVTRLTQNSPEPLRVLFILVLLVPLEALDSVLLAVFACFGNARAIFFRRHIVAPAFRLAAVAAGILSQASITVLAYGYVIGAVAGLLIYGRLVWRLCRDAGLFHQVRAIVPAREVFAFTLPLIVSDVALAIMYSAGALALGYYADMATVAVFTAAVPLAVLNQTVMRSFSLLYTSSASKLFARGDSEGINDLYWLTAVWLAVLSFPIFALTFSAAGAITQVLFGSQYAAAAQILALLALGEYVNVALGFNGLTLRIMNRSGYLTAISVGAAAVTVGLVFWAAPRYGAWGVAAATAAAMVVHNLLKQLGLRYATGVSIFNARYAGFYFGLAAAAAALMAASWPLRQRPVFMLALSVVVSAGVLWLSGRVLRITDVFPELRRLPLLRHLWPERAAVPVRPGHRTVPWLKAAGMAGLFTVAGLGITAALVVTIDTGPALVALMGMLAAVVVWLHPGVATVLGVFLLYANLPSAARGEMASAQVFAASFAVPLAIPAIHRVIQGARPVFDRTFLLMLAYLLVLLISSFVAVDWRLAAGEVLQFVAEGLILYWLLLQAIRTQTALRRVMWTVVLTGAFLGSLSLYQQATGEFATQFAGLAKRQLRHDIAAAAAAENDVNFISAQADLPVRTSQRAAGPVGDPNRFAQILIIAVPWAVFLAAWSRRRAARLLGMTAAALILGGIGVTYSRGAFVTMAVLFAALWVWRLVRPMRLATAAAVAALAVIALAPNYVARMATIANTSAIVAERANVNPDGAIRGRATEVLAALWAFADHPFLGVGPGQYPQFYSESYQQRSDIKFRQLAEPRQAHNLFASVAAETGIVGLIVFLGMFGTLIVRLARARRYWLDRNQRLADLAVACQFSLFAALGTGFFLHMAYWRYQALLLGVVGAALHILRAAPRERRELTRDDHARAA